MFDHSSCHAAMVDDALDVNRMNVGPGVKQIIMTHNIMIVNVLYQSHLPTCKAYYS